MRPVSRLPGVTDFKCDCGFEASAESVAALTPTALAHFTEVHPEFGVVEINVSDYLTAQDRLTGSTERLEEIGGIEIREVGDDGLEDIQRFFDAEAFAGNPEWAACYCMFHHIGQDAPEWRFRGFEENRTDMVDRIRTGSTTGVVAYVDGKLAGWCNATVRSEFPDHVDSGGAPDEQVGSIVCFLVGPPYRGHGVARALLDGACDMLARRGMTVAEGYPRPDAKSAESAYRGTPELFSAAGFELVGDGPAMRKSLV